MAPSIIDFFRREGESDALADPAAVREWLAAQPKNDDLGLQEAMIRMLEDMGARQPKVTPARVRAVLELDRCSLPQQMRLLKQYLHPSLSDLVRQRLWHANDDLARWFAYTYENLFAAIRQFLFGATTKALAPAVASRMFHYRGEQAKQGLFRYERWIPVRWKSLHEAYIEAFERGAARTRFSLDPASRPAAQLSAEEEYIQIMLLQRVNNGNLTAPQIELAAEWLRGSAQLLALAPPPLEGDGFWLDLGLGDGLLVAKPQSPQGPVLYLDVAPLHAEMRRTQEEHEALAARGPAAQRQAEADGQLELLRRIGPLLRPEAKPVERRGTRTATDRPVGIAVGLSEIAAALASSRRDREPGVDARSPGDGKARSAAPAGASAPRAGGEPLIEVRTAAETPAQAVWRMHDSSESGCRLVSDAQDGLRLRLGAILGIQAEGDDRWRIGIVRRIKRLAAGRIEVGVELIALHSLLIAPRPVTLRDADHRVDGFDVTAGDRSFDALYLPPSSGGRIEPQRSMLVPAHEFDEHRRLFVDLGNTAYSVELTRPLERGKDWVWTRFSVVSRSDQPDRRN